MRENNKSMITTAKISNGAKLIVYFLIGLLIFMVGYTQSLYSERSESKDKANEPSKPFVPQDSADSRSDKAEMPTESGEEELFVQLEHSGLVFSVAFSPDGKYALSGSADTTLRLWDVSTGKKIRQFIGHSDVITSVAFSPDGKYALSGNLDGTMRLWDINTGK
jgi:WD40 repeat protein